MRLPRLSESVMSNTYSAQSPAGIAPAQATRSMVPRLGTFSSPGLIGGVLGFSCGSLACTCSGDNDCNDMFSTNACGPYAVCDETGGRVKCVCLRH